MMLSATKTVFATTFAIGLMAATTNSEAAIVFADNFEDGTVGQRPNAPQIGSYPSVAPLIPESFVRLNGGVYPESVDSGTKVLAVVGKQRNYVTVSASGTGIVKYDFDLYTNVGTSGGATLSTAFGMTGSSGSLSLDSQPTSIWLQLTATGAVQAYSTSGGAWQTIPGLTTTPGSWNDVSIEYELGATEYTITVNDTSVVSTRFNGTTFTNDINYAFVMGGSDAVRAFADNIEVSFSGAAAVPEPASFGLLAGIAGAAMLRRRRASM